MSAALEAQLRALAQELKLPSVGRDAVRLAEEGRRQGTSFMEYLVQVLDTEVSERRQRRAERRVKEAGFPIVKTLSGFDFSRAPHLPEARILELATGGYIRAAEPVIFIGEPGTGKTHLATSLGVAAATAGLRVRFRTAAALVTELVESRDAKQLSRIVRRYARVDLLILDELAYLPFARSDAELLFRVLGERHERLPIVVTTNLPFSEWTSMFPEPRLCQAVVDRLTHRAHILETGAISIRLDDTLKKNHRFARAQQGRPAKDGQEFSSA